MTAKTKHFVLTSRAIIGLLILGASTQAIAGGYQLSREYNAVEIGNAGAGGAAIATDASTAYANPAGLVRIPNKQLVVSADPIFTGAQFKGSNTRTSLGLPAFTQTGSAKSVQNTIIPAFHFAMPLNIAGLKPNKWNFGFSVTTPFGLGTNYGNNSIIRYSSTLAKIQVIDFSPTLAFAYNEQLSFGAGVDFDHFDLDFRTILGAPPVSTALDSTGKNVGNGWGYGFHGGVLFHPTPATRVGLAYHSSVKSNISGYSSLSGRLVSFPPGTIARTITLDSFHTRFILPPSTVLSAFHNINSTWAVDGTISYTQWSALSGTQTAYNLPGLPAITPVTVNLQQHYNNTWMLALGGEYRLNPMWLLRAGVNFDQSPIKNSERNVTLPDSNRTALAIGAHFDLNKQFNFDGGWTHIFFNDSTVSTPIIVGSQTSTATGSYTSNRADVLGVQMNWNFV